MVARSECLSLPPSVIRPDPTQEILARKKVMQWRGKEVAGTIKTWREGWEIRYGKDDASIYTSEMFADWESRATTLGELLCGVRPPPPGVGGTVIW